MLTFQKGKNLGIGKIEKYAPQKCLTFGGAYHTKREAQFHVVLPFLKNPFVQK